MKLTNSTAQYIRFLNNNLIPDKQQLSLPLWACKLEVSPACKV